MGKCYNFIKLMFLLVLPIIILSSQVFSIADGIGFGYLNQETNKILQIESDDNLTQDILITQNNETVTQLVVDLGLLEIKVDANNISLDNIWLEFKSENTTIWDAINLRPTLSIVSEMINGNFTESITFADTNIQGNITEVRTDLDYNITEFRENNESLTTLIITQSDDNSTINLLIESNNVSLTDLIQAHYDDNLTLATLINENNISLANLVIIVEANNISLTDISQDVIDNNITLTDLIAIQSADNNSINLLVGENNKSLTNLITIVSANNNSLINLIDSITADNTTQNNIINANNASLTTFISEITLNITLAWKELSENNVSLDNIITNYFNFIDEINNTKISTWENDIGYVDDEELQGNITVVRTDLDGNVTRFDNNNNSFAEVYNVLEDINKTVVISEDINASGFLTSETDLTNYTTDTYNNWNEKWSSMYNETYDVNYTSEVFNNILEEQIYNHTLSIETMYVLSLLYNHTLSIEQMYSLIFLYNQTTPAVIESNAYTDTQLSTQDECSEITGCVENAITSYVDTNASSICSNDEMLLGNGSCMSIGDLPVGASFDDTAINTTIDGLNQTLNNVNASIGLVKDDAENKFNATYDEWTKINQTQDTYNNWNNAWTSTFNQTYDDASQINYTEEVFNNIAEEFISNHTLTIEQMYQLIYLYNQTTPAETFALLLTIGLRTDIDGNLTTALTFADVNLRGNDTKVREEIQANITDSKKDIMGDVNTQIQGNITASKSNILSDVNTQIQGNRSASEVSLSGSIAGNLSTAITFAGTNIQGNKTEIFSTVDIWVQGNKSGDDGFNNINVAYLNNSQQFTGENKFDNSPIFTNLTSCDVVSSDIGGNLYCTTDDTGTADISSADVNVSIASVRVDIDGNSTEHQLDNLSLTSLIIEVGFNNVSLTNLVATQKSDNTTINTLVSQNNASLVQQITDQRADNVTLTNQINAVNTTANLGGLGYIVSSVLNSTYVLVSQLFIPTNVGYLNNTQSWTGNNTWNKDTNVTMDTNVTISEDNVLHFDGGHKIYYDGGELVIE